MCCTILLELSSKSISSIYANIPVDNNTQYEESGGDYVVISALVVAHSSQVVSSLSHLDFWCDMNEKDNEHAIAISITNEEADLIGCDEDISSPYKY